MLHVIWQKNVAQKKQPNLQLLPKLCNTLNHWPCHQPNPKQVTNNFENKNYVKPIGKCKMQLKNLGFFFLLVSSSDLKRLYNKQQHVNRNVTCNSNFYNSLKVFFKMPKTFPIADLFCLCFLLYKSYHIECCPPSFTTTKDVIIH